MSKTRAFQEINDLTVWQDIAEDSSSIDQEKLDAAYKMLSYVPNPGLAEAHADDRALRGIFGGNRSGKTVWGLQEVGFWAYGIHPYFEWVNQLPRPVDIRICCTTFKQGIQGVILPGIREWWPKGSYHIKEDRDVKVWEQVGNEKRLMANIELMSYDQDLDAFGGQAKNLIWCDEEPPYAIWKENLMRLLDMDGYLLLTMTPIFGMTWVYEDVYLSEDVTNVGVYQASTLNNPHLSKKAIDKIRAMIHSKDDEAVRLYGQFIPTSHFIYPAFDRTVHVVDPLSVWNDKDKPGQLPDDWMVVLGIDPHERTPHGVIFCGIDRDANVYIFDEISEHCLISDLAQLIKKRLDGRIPAYSMIDSSAATESSIAGRSMIQEFARPGNDILVLSTKKGAGSVLEGIQKVRDYLRFEKNDRGIVTTPPQLRIFSNCVKTIREFRLYVWEDWKGINRQNKDPKETPLKKDDHLLDALRYVLMTQPVYRHPALSRKMTEGLTNRPSAKPRNKFTGN